MKFGVFDHLDRPSLTLADQFDRRLDYVAALEEAGFSITCRTGGSILAWAGAFRPSS